jgi:photosystem II stability/assembly factor-like uncharacterized protein
MPKRFRIWTAAVLPAAVLVTASAVSSPETFTLTPQRSGTDQLLIAVSPVDVNTAWVAGTGGTFLRTEDGGETWMSGVVPGADSLQFRDVYAVNALTAWLLSAGTGDASRIYRTADGGRSWTLQFTNQEPAGFYDCLDFWDPENGILYGDAVDGQLRVRVTTNGGAAWPLVEPPAVPTPEGQEGGFAASGTCAVVGPDGRGWIATGAGDVPRVLRTEDMGRTWSAVELPLPAGEAAGAFSIAFRSADHGLVFGGDLQQAEASLDNIAVTEDGGRTWAVTGRPTFPGAIYGGAYVPGAGPTAVTVGPGGANYTIDDGQTWALMDTLTYWGVGFASAKAGWIVGPEGRITKVAFE